MWAAILQMFTALLSALLPMVWDRLDRPNTGESAKLDAELKKVRDDARRSIRDFEGI